MKRTYSYINTGYYMKSNIVFVSVAKTQRLKNYLKRKTDKLNAFTNKK